MRQERPEGTGCHGSAATPRDASKEHRFIQQSPWEIRYDGDKIPIIEETERVDIVGDGVWTRHMVLWFPAFSEENTMYARVQVLQWLRHRSFDWGLMQSLGIEERIRQILTDWWAALLTCDSPLYIELTREFYSTFRHTNIEFQGNMRFHLP